MNVLDYIPQLAAAGAMGVSILCIIRVAALLKKEQERDDPRPVFLRSIYVFMAFGLIMTLVALGIEASRFFMGTGDGELARITTDLEKIAANGYYALNQNGNPARIEIDVAGKSYLLGEAFPDTAFGATPLNLVDRGGRYRAVKNNNGQEINYGYFPEQELKGKLAGLFDDRTAAGPTPAPVSQTAAATENLYAAGVAYAPGNVKSRVSLKQLTDRTKANRRLLDFLSRQGFENDRLREDAVVLLMQPAMLDKLSEDGHDRLIELLSDNNVRAAPWRYYEAAQVYLSRYRLAEQPDPADLEQHLALSRKYIEAFRQKGWTEENHPGEWAYYLSAVRAVE